MASGRQWAVRMVCGGAVVASAATLSRGDESSETMVVYAPGSGLAAHYRLWNGSSWSAAANMPAVSGSPRWIVARNCAVRNETACVMLDRQQDLHITFFDGEIWSPPGLLCKKAGGNRRVFDVAYEAGGDMVVVYFDRANNRDDDGDGDSDGDDDEKRDKRARKDRDGDDAGRDDDDDDDDEDGDEDGDKRGKRDGDDGDRGDDDREDEDDDEDDGDDDESGGRFGRGGDDDDGKERGKDEDGKERKRGEKKGWRYRTYSGGAVSSEMVLTLSSTSHGRWVRLVPQPSSERMLLLASDKSKELHAAVWTGSVFENATTIGTDLSESSTECWSAAYESQSRDGVIVYTEGSSATVRFRTVTESTFGAEQPGPTMGSHRLKWLHAAARPGSDGVMLAALNSKKELHAAYWDGTDWGPSTMIAESLQSDQQRNFGVAFQPNGEKCVVIHSAAGSGVICSRAWDGAAWGPVQNGSDGGSPNAVFALFPGSGGEVFGLVSGRDKDLMSVRWTGAALSAHTELSSTLEGGSRAQPFTMVTPAQPEDSEEDGGTAKRVINWRETDPR